MIDEGAAISDDDGLHAKLATAMAGADTALAAADLLCRACVQLFRVDGASVSLTHDGSTQGTFGSSGDLSRRLDELQFTFGEGPCLDAVRHGQPILVADLRDPAETRWPAFAGALVRSGINAVFALPVTIASKPIGALDLFRRSAGGLGEPALTGGLLAAELAALPLMDLMSSGLDWDTALQGGDGWEQLASLSRVEVYQATGMLIGALDVGPTEALLLLRAYAFAHDMTATDAAWAIVEGRLSLDPGDWLGPGRHREEPG
ncbi:GAF and ANTAR domain-containing protein [Blastococcus sp. VKM Ac-2987]|uniref:GAF and ANTAR domain-containing protein n=1 Tax=Blastococcus sp. VKM Ac-2987 TaxID=3004141 RepID=UPI0022ABBC45|nr:GAF and ANTAR domain-containing protein [Blastococcus sp. VKM Ac-2987]MCZ2858018.1 GAF and ANTAR domain-containing protein [Blastococcus sp. VKM Ac-2987]